MRTINKIRKFREAMHNQKIGKKEVGEDKFGNKYYQYYSPYNLPTKRETELLDRYKFHLYKDMAFHSWTIQQDLLPPTKQQQKQYHLKFQERRKNAIEWDKKEQIFFEKQTPKKEYIFDIKQQSAIPPNLQKLKEDDLYPILITATSDGCISLWNTKKSQWFQEEIEFPKSEFSVNRLALASDKMKLVAGCSDGIRLYDIKAVKPIMKIKQAIDERSNVISVGFDCFSNWIYYSTESGSLNILDLRDGKVNCLLKQTNDINCSILNPNQEEIIFGDSDGYIKVFDLKKNSSEASLSVIKGLGIRSLAFSNDSSLLAVASSDGQLRTLQLSKKFIQKETTIQHVHDDYILNVRISKDKKYLVTSSADKTIKVFEIEDTKLTQKWQFYAHTQWVWDISLLSNSKHLLSVSTDRYLKLWNLSNGKCVKEFYNYQNEVPDYKMFFSKGYVAMAFQDEVVQPIQKGFFDSPPSDLINQTINIMDHKLQCIWTFWYSPRGKNSRPEASKNYESNLTKLGDVSTVEEFLSYYCYIRKPSDIPVDHKVIFFRQGQRPCWEDWPDGGCWILQIKKKEESHQYNLKWERLILAAISEELGNNIVGLVLSVRQKKNLIEIWLKDAKDEEERIIIGEKVREILELEPQNLVFYFKEHQKSLQEGSTLKGIEHYSFFSTPVESPIGTPIQDELKADPNIQHLDFTLQ